MGGNSKSSALFISLLKRLKATYRRAKTITLIVDNYIIHKSRETQSWLKGAVSVINDVMSFLVTSRKWAGPADILHWQPDE